MRPLTFLAAVATLGLGAYAFAGSQTATERARMEVAQQIAIGSHQLARVTKFTSNAARLDALDDAIRVLRHARVEAGSRYGDAFADLRSSAETDLVSALDAEGRIYFERKSLPLAKKRVAEALGIAPYDARARNLDVMISAADRTDIYDKYQGNAAVQRIRDRRAGAGLPLRNRGVATRR